MTQLEDAIDAYRLATDELARLHVERAEALAAELTVRSTAYADLCARGDRNITQIREEADWAAREHKVSAIKLAGGIDAFNARLRYLDVQLAHIGVIDAPGQDLG